MLVLRRFTVLWAITIACSGNPAPDLQATRLTALALASRCPVTGIGLRQVVTAWGKPDSLLSIRRNTVAYFKGPQ
jgi:hypothetical protein